MPISKENFLTKYKIKTEGLDGSGLKGMELEKIYNDYQKQKSELEWRTNCTRFLKIVLSELEQESKDLFLLESRESEFSQRRFSGQNESTHLEETPKMVRKTYQPAPAVVEEKQFVWEIKTHLEEMPKEARRRDPSVPSVLSDRLENSEINRPGQREEQEERKDILYRHTSSFVSDFPEDDNSKLKDDLSKCLE
jgi:hypothetical protein